MADSDLVARLSAHEHAFESLLDLIPAKFYNPEDASTQWNKRKQTKEEAVQAKRAKLDPEKMTRRTHASTETPTTTKKSPVVPSRRQKKGATKPVVATDAAAAAAAAAAAVASPAPTEDAASVTHAPDPNRNITALRAKLAAKIEALRSKRKAPGSGVEGAPKSREAILEARRKKEEARREKKKLEREARQQEDLASDDDDDDDNEDDVVEQEAHNDNDEDDEDDEDEESGIAFGRVGFSDGQWLTQDATALKSARARKQQDTKSALQAALHKKARLAALPEDARASIAESDTWHKALLHAEGAKVKDNLTLLKAAAKRKDAIKAKSATEWKERLASIAKAKALKQKNREQNLKDRRESKGKTGGHKKGKQIGAYQGKKSGSSAKGGKGKAKARGF